MQIIDLSHPIISGMPTFEGALPPTFEWRSTFEKKGRCSSVINLSVHTATHVDAPLHFIPDGTSVDQLSLNLVFGPATPIFIGDLPREGRLVDHRAFVERAQKLIRGDIVVIYSGLDRLFGQPGFSHDFPVLSDESVAWLLEKAIRAYGTDAPAVDPLDSIDFPNHKALLGAGVPIIEGLANLDALEGKRVLMCALPIKLDGREGGPCRAVAIRDIDIERLEL